MSSRFVDYKGAMTHFNKISIQLSYYLFYAFYIATINFFDI
jgi:hypothetical protein